MRKKTIEDYVELFYDIQKEKKKVHTSDIASALSINPASVTEIFQKLSNEGYINYEKYSGATLTNKGIRVAKKTLRKHNVLKELLLLLGIEGEIAERDACEMEHILHPQTMDMIIKFVEVINQCEITPFWLQRLKKYGKTGKLSRCPPELIKICLKYAKKT